MRIIGVTALWLLLATALPAEDGSVPDFSGTWIFNPAKSRLEMTAPTKSIFWIEHQNARFRLTRTHTWGERWDTLSFEAGTDGEELYRENRGFETWTRMFWKGEELVLDMRLAYRGEQGTNVVHYRLADEGKTFIAAEWYHMPREQHHNLWVFDRSSEAAGFEDEDRMKDFAEGYAAAWGSQDPDRVAGFFAENGSLRVNDGEPAVGRGAIAGVAQEFMTALPDMTLRFDGLEARDGRVRFHWTLEATNSGPGGTGKRVRVSGYESWRLDEDGLIAESQGHFPTAEYERQLEVGYDGTAGKVGVVAFPDGEVQHVVRSGDTPWQPCPKTLPPGCEMAVLDGNPMIADLFTVRFRVRDTFVVPPHTHPKDERVTVISGSVAVAFGADAERQDATEFGPGDYYVNARDAVHQVWIDGPAVIQITGIGPWKALPVQRVQP